MGAAEAWINRIETALPAHEVHGAYRRYAMERLAVERERAAFARLDGRSGIERRWSVIEPATEGRAVDAGEAFHPGAFPDIGRRMQIYAHAAPALALDAIDRLLPPEQRACVTHLILCSCTGFSAPGVDIEIIARAGLRPEVERTLVGFMGCHGAMNALKLARHVVRSEPGARVLVVSVELCTLHLRDTGDLGALLSFGLWGDGAAAALVSAQPEGVRIDGFETALELSGGELMRWDIRQDAFDMVLSGHVPGAVRDMLAARRDAFAGSVDLWAVHPGGRAVLDAVQMALALPPDALDVSRRVLRDHGNMSSATVLFVLRAMMQAGPPAGARGLAMAFGPGLTAETMRFGMAD